MGDAAQTDAVKVPTSEAHARARDLADPLAPFRQRFYPPDPPGTLYLDGNSLGVAGEVPEVAALAALEERKRRA